MVAIRVGLLTLLILVSSFCESSWAIVNGKSVDLKTIEVTLPSPYGELKGEIHFDEKDRAIAFKVQEVIKNDLIKIINYFHYVPKSIVHFNIDPYMRLTNGNARTFPTNIVNLYNFPPDNSEHLIVMEDWLRGLVFHEYVHITHLDKTSDWTELGRKIFGSIATLPAAIVPRWFAEGIAVWGESHLLGVGGRLNNPLFRKELLMQFLKKESCQSIDCLDEPGVHPGGQLAYWAGGHFIEYLEEKKNGTVKCLVEKNSGSIPFFLNNVFRYCTEKEASEQFEDFRQHLIASQPSVSAESEGWGVKINNVFGSSSFQKGFLLEGNILYKVERNKKSEALVSYDLEENVNMATAKFPFPIDSIAEMTTMPVEGDQDSGKYLLVSFNEDMHFREKNREWKLINAETLLEEMTIPFVNDPSYVISLPNQNFLTASFVDNAWKIERQKFNFAQKKIVETHVLHQFPVEMNLTLLKKRGQRIFLKFNQKSGVNAFFVSDLSLESFFKIYESMNYYDLPLLTDKNIVIREKKETTDQFTLYEFDESLKTISSSQLSPEIFNRVTNVEMNEGRVLILENDLKSKAVAPEESLTYFKRGEKKLSSVALTKVDLTSKTSSHIEEQKGESFPKWHHFKPHYWFLATGSSENISSLGVRTTFSDPMDLTTLETSLVSYSSINKLGGNLEFSHKFAKVTDLWSLNALFDRDFFKSGVSQRVNETKEGFIGTNYTLMMKRWTMLPGIYFGMSKKSDFISESSAKNVGFSNVLLYKSLSFDETFQSLFSQLRVQIDDSNRGENFIDAKFKLQSNWRFHERIEGNVKTSWAKLFKTNFDQGVVYAGGINNFSVQRWHEFYGIPYGNAYGNEIFTFRSYLDYNVWDIYRGRQFIPLFFKELHLLLGYESMYADRILLDKKILREKFLHGFFAGPRLKANLFYFIPADIDVIFSSIKNPNGKRVNDVIFNINADMF